VIDDYYGCFKYITSIIVIYSRILSGSRIGCAVRNKKTQQLEELNLCLLFFCTGYRKSSAVGIGVRDNFATILELPAASSRKRIKLDWGSDWTTLLLLPRKGSSTARARQTASTEWITGRTGSLYQPSWRGRGGEPGSRIAGVEKLLWRARRRLIAGRCYDLENHQKISEPVTDWRYTVEAL